MEVGAELQQFLESRRAEAQETPGRMMCDLPDEDLQKLVLRASTPAARREVALHTLLERRKPVGADTTAPRWMLDTMSDLRRQNSALKGQLDKAKTTARPMRIAECFYCGKPVIATRDHFIPYTKGGRGSVNLVGACRPCNISKSDRLPSREEIRRFVKLCASLGVNLYDNVVSDCG